MAMGDFRRERGKPPTTLLSALQAPAPEQWAAWSGIVLIHMLVLWTATRPSLVVGDAGPAMELVFIQPSPPVLKAGMPAADRDAAPTASAGKPQSTRIASFTSPTAPTPAGIPQVAANDQWDLAAGRSTEIDALCGEVVRLAQAQGRDAPRNARMVALVRAWPEQPVAAAIS